MGFSPMVDLTEQDLLTGVLHAGAFSRRVDGALQSACASDATVALVVAEFPLIADDAVLVEAARRVRDVTRSHDVVGRTSSAELAVCCATATEAEGRAVARRLREALAQPFELDGEYLCLPIGIGLFVREPVLHTDTTEFMVLAARARIDVP